MRTSRLLALFVFAALLLPTSMWADAIWTSNGYTFTATGVSGGDYAGGVKITFTVKNASGATGYLQGFALKDTTIEKLTIAALDSGSGTATAKVGFNNGSGNCSGNDSYSVCVDQGLGTAIASNQTLTYVISLGGSGPLTMTDLSGWHLQTLVTDQLCHGTGCTGADDASTKTVVAISLDATPSVSTPEPATLSLLGIGLLGIGAIRRKR